MKPGATIEGGPVKSRSQSRRTRPSHNWPVIILLGLIALLLLLPNYLLSGAVGCALLDWLSPYIATWSN